MNEVLNKLKRLSEVKENKDIKSCSNAIFPGTHCPLFGVNMIAAKLEGLASLVIGTSECTFYSKDFSILRNGDLQRDNTWSYVMSEKEIVFGAQDGLKRAIIEIDKTGPKGILIISTCVPELIGYDIVGICNELQEDVNAVLLPVQTEHFNQNSHMSGITRTLEALGSIMSEQNKIKKSINILGWRGKSLHGSELFNLLEKQGVNIHLMLPTEGSIDSVISAPSAELNIVMDFTALALAKKMKDKFNIPYVEFDRILDTKKIYEGYKEIEKALNISFGDELEELKDKAEKEIEQSIEILNGKKFVYGNTMFNVFRYTHFLATLGMKTDYIQIRELYEGDEEWINKLLEMGCNPYTAKIANIGPLDDVYKLIKPDFYIGHEDPMRLMKLGIIQTASEGVDGIGFELPVQVVNSLVNAYKCKDIPNNKMLKMMKMMGGI